MKIEEERVWAHNGNEIRHRRQLCVREQRAEPVPLQTNCQRGAQAQREPLTAPQEANRSQGILLTIIKDLNWSPSLLGSKLGDF